MDYLHFIQQLNNAVRADFQPLYFQNNLFGFIRSDHFSLLSQYGFSFSDWENKTNMENRSKELMDLVKKLNHAGIVTGWRDELFPIHYKDNLIATIERSAVSFFGIKSFGVHLNVYSGRKMWLARRSPTKTVEPNKLDQLVAGGVAYGLSLKETVIKEAHEEAGIPFDLAKKALPVGLLRYVQATENGVRRDVIYHYDLEVPPDFQPINQDGEVAEFFQVDFDDLSAFLPEFKGNSALTLIDFMIRRGFIPPEYPNYEALCSGLIADLWEE